MSYLIYISSKQPTGSQIQEFKVKSSKDQQTTLLRSFGQILRFLTSLRDRQPFSFKNCFTFFFRQLGAGICSLLISAFPSRRSEWWRLNENQCLRRDRFQSLIGLHSVVFDFNRFDKSLHQSASLYWRQDQSDQK